VALGLAVIGSSGYGTATSAPFRVSLGYAPSPTDPLLITFTATVVPGTPTLFNWSFGDGQFFNGSGPAYLQPVHLYPPAGGSFVVTLTVHEGVEVNATSIALSLIPASLTAQAQASPSAGNVPLTVTFQATIAGGSGTYRSFTWDFGTGDRGSGIAVAYTFTHPGHFLVSVNVTDSAGQSVIASTEISATGTPTVGAGSGPGDAVVAGAGAAVGAVGAAGAILVWQRRPGLPTRHRSEASPLAASTLADGVRTSPPTAPAPSAIRAGPPSPAPPVLAPSPPPTTDALRISQRIVLHLGSQGALGPHEVAPIGFSQPGMSKALGIRQNALTNVLRRLVAADVVVEDVRHVQGQPRRLKVYQLTPRGEALARELRHPRLPRVNG